MKNHGSFIYKETVSRRRGIISLVQWEIKAYKSLKLLKLFEKEQWRKDLWGGNADHISQYLRLCALERGIHEVWFIWIYVFLLHINKYMSSVLYICNLNKRKWDTFWILLLEFCCFWIMLRLQHGAFLVHVSEFYFLVHFLYFI